MVSATVTSKGQITIPVEIRRQLAVEPGDRLVFHVRGDTLNVRVLHTRKLADMYGALPATRPFPGTAEVRGEVAADLGRRMAEEPR